MENNAHGGFVIYNKQGNPILAQGEFSADGQFQKGETDRMEIRPHQAIAEEMMEKGLWGSYLFNSIQNETELSK